MSARGELTCGLVVLLVLVHAAWAATRRAVVRRGRG